MTNVREVTASKVARDTATANAVARVQATRPKIAAYRVAQVVPVAEAAPGKTPADKTPKRTSRRTGGVGRPGRLQDMYI